MRAEFKILLSGLHDEPPDQTPWEWNRDNVDFARVPNYDTPHHVPYDPDFMPFWKEPQEAAVDPAVREVWILKDERSGASENVALNLIRYHIAIDPESILYLSGDQKLTEGFFTKRIKRGMGLSDVLKEKYDRSSSSEHLIDFGDMDLTITWPNSPTAFKQDGYPTVLGDELSLWKTAGPQGMRGRTGSYSYSHVIGISSLDSNQKRSTDEDPIWIEFHHGDMRYWFMPDPKTGDRFRFEFGDTKSPFGLKWSQKARRGDGSWDFQKVRDTAFYLTPDGTVIRNKDRMKAVMSGKWKATNRKAAPGVRSYHISAFYSPFERGDFGEIAVNFLIAKKKGKEYYRAWLYNTLADAWHDDAERIRDDILLKRRAKYNKGEYLSECEQKNADGERYSRIYLQHSTMTLMTVDVQRHFQPVVIREWIDTGDSGLVYWENTPTFDTVANLLDEYDIDSHGVDYGYTGRLVETLEFCEQTGGLPLLDRANLTVPFAQKLIDPREGVSGQGKNKIVSYTFQAHTFRSILLAMMTGESMQRWYTYWALEHTYIQQVVSTELVAGKWKRRKGYGKDDFFDCEVMQVVMATIGHFYAFDWAQDM